MTKKKLTDLKLYSSEKENEDRTNLLDLFENSPLPQDQILNNLGLYIESKWLSRILFWFHITILL